MGTMLEYACSSCSYEASAQAHHGFAGIEYQPMSCSSCRRVVSVPVRIVEGPHQPWSGEEPPKLGACPSCGEDSDLRKLSISAGGESAAEQCPRCGDKALTASVAGIWD